MLAAKRAEHPELCGAVTPRDARRVCAREGILYCEDAALPRGRHGLLVPFLGQWAVLVSGSLPPHERSVVALHELAHRWLHAPPGSPSPGGAIFSDRPEAIWMEEAECALFVHACVTRFERDGIARVLLDLARLGVRDPLTAGVLHIA